MRNAGLDEAQAGIKIAGRNINTSDMQMTPPLWQKVKRNSKASSWKWKRRVKKLAYISTFRKWRYGIRSHHFMANRWGNNGNSDFIFLGSKITADGGCSHEIKRHLLIGRKPVTNIDSILKSRDIILLTKFCIVKAKVFPVIMWGWESWTIKLSAKELMLSNCDVG